MNNSLDVIFRVRLSFRGFDLSMEQAVPNIHADFLDRTAKEKPGLLTETGLAHRVDEAGSAAGARPDHEAVVG
ncbi:MAG: hypothetical protein Q7V17_05915, partial [Afipia sp.]|nr:hypothetical protein [Afipia sp.]